VGRRRSGDRHAGRAGLAPAEPASTGAPRASSTGSCLIASGRARAAAAGAAAATIWGVLEPLDQRLLRYGYSDIALLGKAVTRGPAWRPIGFAVHAVNGAVFGLAYDRLRQSAPVRPQRLAIGMAVAEHLALYPLNALVDRHHPARGEPGLPPLLKSPRAFAQATWRHVLFGALLGRLAR
jgi:hypothetical protein